MSATVGTVASFEPSEMTPASTLMCVSEPTCGRTTAYASLYAVSEITPVMPDDAQAHGGSSMPLLPISSGAAHTGGSASPPPVTTPGTEMSGHSVTFGESRQEAVLLDQERYERSESELLELSEPLVAPELQRPRIAEFSGLVVQAATRGLRVAEQRTMQRQRGAQRRNSLVRFVQQNFLVEDSSAPLHGIEDDPSRECTLATAGSPRTLRFASSAVGSPRYLTAGEGATTGAGVSHGGSLLDPELSSRPSPSPMMWPSALQREWDDEPPALRPPSFAQRDSQRDSPGEVATLQSLQSLRQWLATQRAEARQRAGADYEPTRFDEDPSSGPLRVAPPAAVSASSQGEQPGEQQRGLTILPAAPAPPHSTGQQQRQQQKAEWQARLAIEPQHPESLAARIYAIWKDYTPESGRDAMMACERQETEEIQKVLEVIGVPPPPGLCSGGKLMVDPVTLPPEGPIADISEAQGVVEKLSAEDAQRGVQRNVTARFELLLWKVRTLVWILRPLPAKTIAEKEPAGPWSREPGGDCWQYQCSGLRRRPPRLDLGEKWEKDHDGELVGILEREWWQSWSAEQSEVLSNAYRAFKAKGGPTMMPVPRLAAGLQPPVGQPITEREVVDLDSLRATFSSTTMGVSQHHVRCVYLQPVQTPTEYVFFWDRVRELLEQSVALLKEITEFVAWRLREDELTKRQDAVRSRIQHFECGLAIKWCEENETRRRAQLIRETHEVYYEMLLQHFTHAEHLARLRLSDQYRMDATLWWVLESDQRKHLEHMIQNRINMQRSREEWEAHQAEQQRRHQELKRMREELHTNLTASSHGDRMRPPRRFVDKFVSMLTHAQRVRESGGEPTTRQSGRYRFSLTPTSGHAAQPHQADEGGAMQQPAPPQCPYCPSPDEHYRRHFLWIGAVPPQRRELLWDGACPSGSRPFIRDPVRWQ
eukprot:TRINITY_DN3270_c1_g1_i1.p1 TRINITY_DN3270_c1_g1~~TRINITY_DN3270_c1_g1_i1.p1  ORF type:complete len:934 (+),score=193.90 TRINITY_DN3270_c1_g1_i1:133-2934(+)